MRTLRARASAEGTVARLVLAAAAMVVLVGLVRLAHDSPLLGLVGLTLAVFLAALAAFGAERVATALILLGMVLAPLTELRVIPGSTLVTDADVCFLVGFGLLAPSLLNRSAPLAPWFLIGSTVVLVIGCLASAAAEHPGPSLNSMARLVATAVAFPVAFSYWRPPIRTLRTLAGGYVVGACLSTGYGYLVEGALEDPYDPGRYNGLSEHPNALALTCLLAISLVPFITSHTSAGLSRLLWWGLAGVCLWGIWISGSRAALLTLLALAVLFPVVDRSVRAAGGLLVAVTVGLLFADRLLVSQSGNPVGRLLGGGSAAGSDQQREVAIATGVRQFLAHPLIGNGFEYALDAHLIYLQVAVSIGLVGLVGYLMMLWPGLRTVVVAPRPLNRIGYPVLAYLIVGLMQPLLWDRYIWCVLALAYTVTARHGDDLHDPGAEPAVDLRPEPHHAPPLGTGALR